MVKNELLNRENEQVAGTYYYTNTNVLDTTLKFAHIVLILNNEPELKIETSILDKVSKDKEILLTMEFWGDKFIQKYDGSPLKEIIDGALNTKLDAIFNTILADKSRIYVRINPEME